MTISNQTQDFKIGDHVTVINGYGLHLKGKKITDIKVSEEGKTEYYLDWDCHWFPVSAKEIYPENPCLVTEIGGINVAEKLLKKYAEYDRISVAIDSEEKTFVALHQLREHVESLKIAA